MAAESLEVDEGLLCGQFVFLFLKSPKIFGLILFDFLRGTRMDAAHVDEERTLDAAATAFAHTAPILKRIAD